MITLDKIMSEIIFANPVFLLVLEHFNIPLGIGDKTVEMICSENNIHTRLFLAIANMHCCKEETTIDPTEFDEQDIRDTVRFLKNSHIFFLKEKLPHLKNLLQGTAPRQNNKYYLLIKKFIDDYSNEVFEHMNYEDQTVFPYIQELLQNRGANNYNMQEFRKHHSDIEAKLADLRNLLIKYLPPEYDSVFRRILLYELSDLEYNINIHDLIENQILVPIVTQMEKREKS